VTLREAVMTMIESAGFTQPIAWPGVNFTPPNNGQWLEVIILENDPQQDYIGNDAPVCERGIITISAVTRPGLGEVGIETLARTVQAAFPKGALIDGALRVTKAPTRRSTIVGPDRIMLPVDIVYGQ
jgi:hypothetical protein